MPKVQKAYTPEFKREVVRLAQTTGKPIAQVARELGISDTSIHQWRKELAEHVKIVFQANREVYGSPRGHAELRNQGVTCARKRVARLMHEQEVFATRASASHDHSSQRCRGTSGAESAAAGFHRRAA